MGLWIKHVDNRCIYLLPKKKRDVFIIFAETINKITFMINHNYIVLQEVPERQIRMAKILERK